MSQYKYRMSRSPKDFSAASGPGVRAFSVVPRRVSCEKSTTLLLSLESQHGLR